MNRNRKMLFLEAFRNIKKRIVSFLSITTIIIIGVCGLMTIYNLNHSMLKKGNDYYQSHNFEDFEVIASVGITGEDVENIEKIDGVSDAEGIYMCDGTLLCEEGGGDVTVLSETKKINIPEIEEGVMPQKAGECAVNESAMRNYGLKTGDKISVNVSSPEGILKEKEFLITGKFNQPSVIGRIEYAVLLPEEAFDKEAVDERYIKALVRIKSEPGEDIFSAKYRKKMDRVRENLKDYANKISPLRTKELNDIANEKLDDAEEEVNDKLSEAEKELTDGEKELNEKLKEAEDEIASNETKIKEGRATLDAEIAKARKQIADGEKELNDKLSAARKEIDEGRAKADAEFAAAHQQLSDAEAQWTGGYAKYAQGEREYLDGKAQVDEGNRQLVEKLSEKSEDITLYSGALAAILDGTDGVISKLENRHPDLASNENWQKFCTGIMLSKILASGFSTATDEERAEILKSMVVMMDEYYAALPYRDEVKEAMKELFDSVAEQHEKVGNIRESVDLIRQLKNAEEEIAKAQAELEKAKAELDAGKQKINAGWAEYNRQKDDAYAKLDEAEREYETGKRDGEKKIADAKAELERLLAEKNAELKEAETKLSEGRKELEETRKEKQKELSDGWAEFREKKADAIKTIEEYREEVKEIGTDNYIVNDRNLIFSYMEYSTTIYTCRAFGKCFLPLFALVSGLVYFSTIAIIIDEQKKQVGAVKALGFFNREVLVKYAVFAGAGSVTGMALGAVSGYILTCLIINPICETYYIGEVRVKTPWISLILLAIACILMGVFVAYFACRRLLKCSAIGLINGSEPESRAMKGKGRDKKRKGGLYSKLIWNNIRMDWERVAVSVVVLMGSLMLIGFGISIRYSFNESNNRQLNRIHKFDLLAVFADDDFSKMTDVEKMLDEKGAKYTECRYTSGLIDIDGRNEGLILISGDPEIIPEYIEVTSDGRKKTDIPGEGLLLPGKCYKRLHSPDTVTLYDNKLYSYKTEVSGQYRYHLGFVALSSAEAYEKLYSTEYVPNCIMIKSDTLSEEELEEAIFEICDTASLNRRNFLQTKGENVKQLFDIVTWIFIILAVLLTFMIQVNLTNILVNRRMRELLVMRVNGFSRAETVGYVLRESVYTFVIGIVTGIIMGNILTFFLIPIMEAEQTYYVRSPYPFAWIVSILFNIAFVAIIDYISFSKIFKVPVTEINRY